MDSLAMFVFICAVLGLFLVWLSRFLYSKYVTPSKAAGSSSSRQSSIVPGVGGGSSKSEKRLSEPRELLASRGDLKELAAVKSSGIGRGRVSSTGSGNTARRRVVRQSSTGPDNRKRRYVPPPSNVIGPETTSVTWTSQVFRWLYSDLVIVNELLMTWVIALNDVLRKSMEEHGIGVEVVRVLPDSPAPGVNNIFCNCDESNPADMNITFDCDAMPVLQVKSIRQKAGKTETSHYKVTVSRFRARMIIAMNYNALKGEMHVDGYPDVRIAMNSVGAIKPVDQDEQQLQSVLGEILANALRDAVYPVDFSIYSTCPRAESTLETVELPVTYPVQYETLAISTDDEGFHGLNGQPTMVSARRLLVKLVKGEGLEHAADPYVVVEMDEPPQKNQTGARKGTDPYWDEHFLFELSPHSAEILFEVYDRPVNNTNEPKFLGLGLVGIDELAVGPASTQVLTLQPRPYETQQAKGAITVDFVFIEGAEIPAGPRPYKLKEALHIEGPTANDQLNHGTDVADAAVRALQEGAFSSLNGQPSKSTVIIHSVQKNQGNPNAFKVGLNEEGKIEISEVVDADPAVVAPLQEAQQDEADEIEAAADSGIEETVALEEIQVPAAAMSAVVVAEAEAESSALDAFDTGDTAATEDEGNASTELANASCEFGQPAATSSPHKSYQQHNQHMNGRQELNGETNGYGVSANAVGTGGISFISTSLSTSKSFNEEPNLDERSRTKKRNFFGTLKKRLNRSKTRTLSADHTNTLNNNKTNNGILHTKNQSFESSPTAAVATAATNSGYANGESSRSLSVDRVPISKSNSLESSVVSAFSTASNKTYTHEASTLVLETIENGVMRHFIVPLAIAQRPKWRRKGTKLHIYNDHTFIAKHLSGGGLHCAICTKSIPRRPGKQGYECRDCSMICHKQCHIRAPQSCPNPTALSMDLTSFPVLREQDLN